MNQINDYYKDGYFVVVNAGLEVCGLDVVVVVFFLEIFGCLFIFVVGFVSKYKTVSELSYLSLIS